jgi:hypothetical protein
MQLQCEGWDGYKCYVIEERIKQIGYVRCTTCIKKRDLMKKKKTRLLRSFRLWISGHRYVAYLFE